MDILTIYKSSAGSGKTTVLTQEYLKLALRKNFSSILAVTFTNKATNELKDRVVKKLNEFSNDASSALAAELMNDLGVGAEEFKRKCSKVLDAILNNYGSFSISTIDAFFQRIIRSFAREAGIQGNFRLEIHHEMVLDEAVKLLLLDAGKNKTLTRWLIRFSNEVTEQGENSDLSAKIASLGAEVFKEEFAAIQSVVSSEATPERFEQLEQELLAIKGEFESMLSKTGRAILDVVDRHGLSVDDFKKGIGSQLLLLASAKIPGFDKSVFGAALVSVDNWYAKNSKRIPEIRGAVEDGILDRLKEIKSYCNDQSTAYLTSEVIHKNLYAFGIITDLIRKIEGYKIENDMLLLSDSSAFLSKIIDGFDSPFIYEKVGSRYQHFLMDEFQDTSEFQWNNFKPLLLNSLAEGEKSVIVGDVKQSIYRWRGGNWSLLGEKIEQQIMQTEIKNLVKNWRSSKKIVEFNNKFFQDAIDETAKIFAMKASKDVDGERVALFEERIRTIYGDVTQEIPEGKDTGEGYVNVQFLPGSDHEFRMSSLEQLPRIVEELQDSGLQARQIAILVRRRQEGEQVASKLIAYSKSEEAREDINYAVVSSEILRVANSPSVNLLVAVLRWINQPEDRISLISFLTDYHDYFSNENRSQEDIFTRFFNRKLDDVFPIDFEVNLPFVSKLPLYELSEEIIRRFRLKDNPLEWPYLLGFQDELLNYTSREAGDLSTFLQWWDKKGWDIPVNISEDIDAIRIMTIHKSKGLEFEAVVMPFCNWKMDPKGSEILWASCEHEPFNLFSFYPLRYSSELAGTYFAESYLKEMSDTFIDNLNLLYVSFTRAAQALYIFCPETSDSRNISQVISEVFSAWKQLGAVEFGSKEFVHKTDIEHGEKRIQLNTFHSGNWNEKVKVSTRELIKLRDDVYKKVEVGMLMHDILSELNSGSILNEKLNKYQLSGRLPLELREEIEQKIRFLLEHEVVGKWFSAKEVLNEKSILDGSGNFRRPDKVLIGADSYTVIDFKNGLERPEHVKQVQEYMQLLSQMDKKKVEGYVLYLQPFSIVSVSRPI